MKLIKQEIEIGDKVIVLEHGRLAKQANSAIVGRCGDTMVLVTVVASKADADLDYFPLFVEYQEPLYAGGRIKGSRWVKREGRPSDDDILTARLIDRSIRPLFPKNYKKEVQVIATVLSVDGENDPGILAMVATSAALSTSDIPWSGPVGSLRVGMKDGTYFANPVSSELKFSDLDLVVTSKKDSLLMIEAGASQVSEEKILKGLEFGAKEGEKIVAGIAEMSEKVGLKKMQVVNEKTDVSDLVSEKFGGQIYEFAKANAKGAGGADSSEIKKAIAQEIGEENLGLVDGAFEDVLRRVVREKVLAGERLDGRGYSEIRKIEGMVGVLPRTHGSAVFQRGQTQVLSATTLGSPGLEQLIETAEGEETKRYMHHYSFPPYSTGETGRVGSPSRREIGHGALAERALLPVVPQEDKFPYTIRVVSQVLGSNGSTSMASTCASTMSLMDAGVPLAAPVAGIAMGLIIEGKKVAVLSDIIGAEDHTGDMDFKVAGTKEGVTAIQLDVKTDSLTLGILKKALVQARAGRLFILEEMLKVIGEPRSKVSEHAPKVVVVHIPKDKIGEVIGPGGATIRKIMENTGTSVDVEDEKDGGVVTITGIDVAKVAEAKEYVEGLVKEVQAGELYEGVVRRIQPFGAFVEVIPGKDGLVHVSDMSTEFVKDPGDVVKIGDKVRVKVKEVDDLGRINLTMLLDGSQKKTSASSGRGPMGRSVGRGRYGGQGGYTGGRGGRYSGGQRRQGEKKGGPHFPASRYLPSKKRF